MTRCFNENKNLGIFDLNPLFNAKQEPRYKEDATNGGVNPFDKSIVNAMLNMFRASYILTFFFSFDFVFSFFFFLNLNFFKKIRN